MILIVLVVLLGLILFLLLSPIWIELDTRVPLGRVRWWGLGRVELVHDKEWIARLSIMFFHRNFYLERVNNAGKTRRKTKKKEQGVRKRQGMPLKLMLMKMKRLLRSFTVEKWQLAIDTGDATLNARLYPLNWMPVLRGHLLVNFNGEEYFLCRIRNSGWRLLRAWFRR